MVDRRAFLQLTGFAALGGVARSAFARDELIVQGASPQELATPLSWFDREITPTPVFFVRSHFGPPAFDAGRTLTIDGMVKQTLTLSRDDLRHFPEVTVTAFLQCAGSGRAFMSPRVPGVQWDHGAMGQATWTGVRLADVLAKAGVAPEAAHLRVMGADTSPKPSVPAFIRSIPLSRALDPTTLIAYRMNGEPLTLAHGAPLRLVVPGWAGDHWVKWLTSLRLQRDEAVGFYMQTAYRVPTTPVEPGSSVAPEAMRPGTTVPVKSVIAKPADGAHTAPGKQDVVGVALSGDAAIRSVEVSIDGGQTWQAATLEGEPGAGRWQVFRFSFAREAPGTVTVMCRATDASGNVQPQAARWNPSGYFWNAWHTVSWQVAG